MPSLLQEYHREPLHNSLIFLFTFSNAMPKTELILKHFSTIPSWSRRPPSQSQPELSVFPRQDHVRSPPCYHPPLLSLKAWSDPPPKRTSKQLTKTRLTRWRCRRHIRDRLPAPVLTLNQTKCRTLLWSQTVLPATAAETRTCTQGKQ